MVAVAVSDGDARGHHPERLPAPVPEEDEVKRQEDDEAAHDHERRDLYLVRRVDVAPFSAHQVVQSGDRREQGRHGEKKDQIEERRDHPEREPGVG